MQTTFELVYPFACLIAAIMLPVMVTPWMYDKPRKVEKAVKAKRRTVRKYKKAKKPKAKKWFKAPKLTTKQQADIERYRLGGNRSQIEIGGVIPL